MFTVRGRLAGGIIAACMQWEAGRRRLGEVGLWAGDSRAIQRAPPPFAQLCFGLLVAPGAVGIVLPLVVRR